MTYDWTELIAFAIVVFAVLGLIRQFRPGKGSRKNCCDDFPENKPKKKA